MVTLNFKEFLQAAPSRTENFIRSFVQLLFNRADIELLNKTTNNFESYSGHDAFTLILLQLYIDKIHEVDIKPYFNLEFSTPYKPSIYEDYIIESTYNKYIDFFSLFDNKEEYCFLTIEDFLKKVIIMSSDNSIIVNTIKNRERLINELSKVSFDYKKKYRSSFQDNIYKNLSSQSIKYLDTVAKICGLIEKQSLLLNEAELVSLSYLLGFYYCDNIAEYKRIYDEQKVIIDYLNKKGINLDVIKKTYGIRFNKDDLNNVDYLLLIMRYFRKNFIKSDSSCDTLGYLFKDFLDRCQSNSNDKKLFNSCNINVESLKDFNESIDESFYVKSRNSLEELYSGLPLATKNAIHKINTIYTYLIINNSRLNRDLVNCDASRKVLAMLIVLYDYDTELKEFLVDKGVTKDIVLKLVGLGTKEEFDKEIAKTEEFSELAVRFYQDFYHYNNAKVSHSLITPDKLFENLKDADYVGTRLIQSIYNTVNNKILDSDFKNKVNSYIRDKRKHEEDELAENVLQNVSIDVCEYLKKVVNIYINYEKNGKLTQVDCEQLSIIIGALVYNGKIRDYFESLGVTKESLCKFFGVADEYTNYNFSIQPIVGPLKKYIFDRDDKDITVYSILENTFKKELTNTLALRSALFKVGLEPEYFIGIEKKLKEYDLKKEKQIKESIIESLYGRIKNEFNDTFIDILKIYEQLNNIQNKDNRMSIAIIIGLLLNNDEHSKYFNNNDIYLDTLLFYYNIDKKIIDGLKEYHYNREIILEFKDIIANREGIESSDLVYIIFNHLDQNVTQKLAEFVRVPHNILKYEVSHKKEKEITPEQGIKILSKEEIQTIDDVSIPSITEYGLAISKHFKHINKFLKELMSNDTLSASVNGVNELLNGIVMEEEIPKKSGVFSWLFADTTVEDKITKYNPEKVTDLNAVIDEYLLTLAKEIKGYNYLKKYIELYLIKLTLYLNYLKELKTNYGVNVEEIVSVEDIQDFTKMLDQKSVSEVLDGKINTFETMIMLMKQELITVHQAIINHFITINSLQISKNAIIPLLTTEIAISMGNKTETDALEISNGLIELLKNVVNNNFEIANANLQRLKDTNMSDIEFQKLNFEITNYLNTASQGTKLLDNIKKDDENEEQIKKI